jgi:hypothetical protein
MSFDIISISPLPEYLRYNIGYDGVGSKIIVIPNAQLVANALNGSSLQKLFSQPYDMNSFFNRFIPSVISVIYATQGSGPPDAWALRGFPDGVTGLVDLMIEKATNAAGGAFLTIQHVHTLIR